MTTGLQATKDETGNHGNLLATLGIPLPSKNRDYRLTYDQINRLQAKDGGYTLMQPLNAVKNAIYDFAESLSDRLAIDGNSDLFHLIRANGGRFSYVDYDQLHEEDGSLFVHQEKEFDIVLPSFIMSFRNRFTIAHELGHYLLHSPKSEAYAMRLGSTRSEWEANWFAAGFLMPKNRFTQAAKEYANNCSVLAALFGVSEQAAKTRVEALGLHNG